MAQLRVTPEQLCARAAEYRNQAEIVNEVIAKLDSPISTLESEWEGVSASKYISQYSNLRQSFVSMRSLITGLSYELDHLANDFVIPDQGFHNF